MVIISLILGLIIVFCLTEYNAKYYPDFFMASRIVAGLFAGYIMGEFLLQR